MILKKFNSTKKKGAELSNVEEKDGLLIGTSEGQPVILGGTVDALLTNLTTKKFGAIAMNLQSDTLIGNFRIIWEIIYIFCSIKICYRVSFHL